MGLPSRRQANSPRQSGNAVASFGRTRSTGALSVTRPRPDWKEWIALPDGWAVARDGLAPPALGKGDGRQVHSVQGAVRRSQ